MGGINWHTGCFGSGLSGNYGRFGTDENGREVVDLPTGTYYSKSGSQPAWDENGKWLDDEDHDR